MVRKTGRDWHEQESDRCGAKISGDEGTHGRERDQGGSGADGVLYAE